MKDTLKKALKHCVQHQVPLDELNALELLNTKSEDIPEILVATNAVRQRKFGNRINLCSIINAKSGACREDCVFCAQSVLYKSAKVERYGLMAQETMVDAFDLAVESPIRNFGIVTSGGKLGERELAEIRETIKVCQHPETSCCASLGYLNLEQLQDLKAAGLKRYHHNLETAPSFFPSICTTHDFEVRVETVKAAKMAGLEVCCGGLLGMGETMEQRVEFAMLLAGLEVDQIPLNFLVPVQGTPMQKRSIMKPFEVLRTIAMFRMVCPEASLSIAAGRVHLRRLQSMIFYAGCNAMMIGDLLTVAGGVVEEDLQMLEDLEFTIVREC